MRRHKARAYFELFTECSVGELTKNQSKFKAKSFPNQLKINQKSLKIALGRSWRFQSGPGGVLRASWESSWTALGRSWCGLGPSWGRLGGVLGRLGASYGCLGDVLEVSCARFSVQRRLNSGMLSWIPFFNRFLVDFASQNRSPNFEKSINSI